MFAYLIPEKGKK